MHVIDLFIDRDGSCIIFTVGLLSTKLFKNPAVNTKQSSESVKMCRYKCLFILEDLSCILANHSKESPVGIHFLSSFFEFRKLSSVDFDTDLHGND